MGRLIGKVAVVTGGASGIGKAIAHGFAREGATVCIADLSAQSSEAAAHEIAGDALGCALDVRDRSSINRLVAQVVERAGGIDILVNCAGIVDMTSLLDVTETDFDRVVGVNTRGLLFVTQAVAAHMIAQGRGGSVVNIASGAGRRGQPGAIVYSISKAGVISFTQSAALELIEYGIRVNAIAPGAVQTPMWTQLRTMYSKTMGGLDSDAVMIAATPAGRLGTPEDQVGAVIYLASPESAHVVGQTLNIDGGMFLN